MMAFFSTLFIHFTLFLSINASPLANIAKREAVDCANPAAVFDQSCWLPEAQGGIDPGKYLADPVTGWIARTPQCTSATASGINCCLPTEPWSTCFLRLARALSGADCSVINAQKCTWDQEVSSTLDEGIRADVRYVLKNIFDINGFFTTYYNALQFAGSHAALMTSSLTTTFNDIKPEVPLMNILSALSAGLAFLGLPEVSAAVAALSTVTRVAAEALTIGLQQAPGLTKALWPAGTAESLTYQISALDSSLSKVQDALTTQINAALTAIMTDVPTFIAFAGNGAFSGSTSLSLPQETTDLDFALKTYLTSESMRQNSYFGWYLGVKEEADVVAGGAAKCVDLGNVFVCSDTAVWVKASKRYFSFKHENLGGYPAAKLKAVVDNKWADLGVLFDGAFDCVVAGNAGGSLVHLGQDNRLDMNCISQLPIYRSDDKDCPAAAADGSCLFGYHTDYP